MQKTRARFVSKSLSPFLSFSLVSTFSRTFFLAIVTDVDVAKTDTSF